MNPSSPTKRVGVRLAGTGMGMPSRVVTNHDLAKLVDTSDEWIIQRTGIRERRLVDGSTATIDLARQALLQALERAGMQPSQLDLILVATLTPEMCCPSTAARLGGEIGAYPAGALDINAACSGFVYGINMASSLIQTGFYRHIAVLGAETLSKVTNWEDRRTCVLFGDGAGAAILTASDDPLQGCLYQNMHSDGGRWTVLYCPRNERDLPNPHHGFNGKFDTLQTDGQEVYKFAVQTLQQTIEQALEACGLCPQDLAMIIPHQSNLRILESARKKLGLPEDKMYINIDRFGNTSAASIPICLHELAFTGRIKQGDLVLFVGIGGGLTWATSVWRL